MPRWGNSPSVRGKNTLTRAPGAHTPVTRRHWETAEAPPAADVARLFRGSGVIGGPFRAGNHNAATVEAKGGNLKGGRSPLFKKKAPGRDPARGVKTTRYHPVPPAVSSWRSAARRAWAGNGACPSHPTARFRRETPGAVIREGPPPAHSGRRLSGGGTVRLSSHQSR